jgi:hypothetical protein
MSEYDIPIPIRGMDAVSRSLELLAEIERHDYAVFSEESKRIGGSVEYESLDTPGALVEVTWVGLSKDMAALKWRDKQYRGRVGRFVRTIQESDYSAGRVMSVPLLLFINAYTLPYLRRIKKNQEESSLNKDIEEVD